MSTTLWGLHAGKYGDADELFLQHNRIALGWPDMGDLAPLAPTRDAFKQRLASVYPGKSKGYVPTAAGQLFRFVHEMKPGDYVVYPSKQSRTVHIGRITGDYGHDPSGLPAYPNRRAVQWLAEAPRTHFSQGPLFEIGSALSLFEVKNHKQDFLSLLKPGAALAATVADDSEEEVAQVAETVKESTRDFVAKRIAKELKGHESAHLVANLLHVLGYNTRVSPPGTDGGIDVVAFKDALGIEPPIVKVQVKSGDGSVGDPEVSQLFGKVDPGEYGLFVTFGTFTKPAKAFASGKSNLRLMDGEEVLDLVLEHYDRLDARYRSVFPLRRVLVPEPFSEGFDL